MRRRTPLRVTATSLGIGLVAGLVSTAAAQTTPSSSTARELAALMIERKLETFAVQETDTTNRFVASLLIPNVQLLLVSADYPNPEELNAQLAQGNYRDVYAALHQPASASTRFFVIDLGCDGIAASGSAVDVLYENGTTQTLFNGDWKSQGLTESTYRKRAQDAEQRYSGALSRLKAGLRASTSGL